MEFADDADVDRLANAYAIARTKRGRAEALTALCRAAEPFIQRQCGRYSTGQIRELERDDALQQTRLAFVYAVSEWDPSRGPIRPYAMWKIRDALQRGAERHFTIRIPRRAAGDRPRVVTSFDAPAVEDRKLSEIIPGNAPDALARMLDDETSEDRRQVAERLGDLVSPLPRERRIMIEQTNNVERVHTNGVSTAAMPVQSTPDAIAALNLALAGMRDYLASLAAEEEALRLKRVQAQEAYAKAIGIANDPEPSARSASAKMSPGRARQSPRRPARTARGVRSGGDLAARVLKLCSQPRKPAEIRKLTGATPGAVSGVLAKLVAADKLVKAGKTRGTTYATR